MELSVYFAGAIKGEAKFQAIHSSVIDAIKSASSSGFPIRVWSEKSPDSIPLLASKGSRQVFLRDRNWLQQSDALIAEISGESFGTGWEVAYAQKVMHIPVLCLSHAKASLPSLIAGNTHQGIYLGVYETEVEIKRLVERFLKMVPDPKSFRWDVQDGLVLPESLDDELSSHWDWIEGSCRGGNSILNLCGLIPRPESLLRRRIRHVFTAMCGPLVEETDFDSSKDLFKFSTQRIKELRRVILFCEASRPSTDQGWLTCYSQWLNCQSIAAFEENADVSWIILGQSPRPEEITPRLTIRPLPFRSASQTRGWAWVGKGPDRPVESRMRWRPPVTALSFGSESALLQRLGLALEEVAKNYHSRETPEKVQAALSRFDIGRHQLQQGRWTRDYERRFLVECLIRDAIWQTATVSGIKGTTFLSGERAELLALLKFHNLAPSPSDLYDRIRHAINYEEKAFAKNLRAFKDVGILLKNPKGALGGSLPENMDLSHFGFELPRRAIQKTLPEFTRARSFVKEQLILTEFGWDLSDYIVARKPKREMIESLLEECRKEIMSFLDLSNLRARVEGRTTYLYDSLAETEHRLIALMVANWSGEPEQALPDQSTIA